MKGTEHQHTRNCFHKEGPSAVICMKEAQLEIIVLRKFTLSQENKCYVFLSDVVSRFYVDTKLTSVHGGCGSRNGSV